jgi:hypothetical protein
MPPNQLVEQALPERPVTQLARRVDVADCARIGEAAAPVARK